MTTVAEVLEKKGRTLHATTPDTTVHEAIRKMVENNVGSLLVMRGDEIAGIITERDYLKETVLKDRPSRTTLVSAIMSTRLVCVETSTTLEECMAVMTEKRCRHLPVLDGGSLCGLISIGDVIKRLSRDQEVHIRYLGEYIGGRYPG